MGGFIILGISFENSNENFIRQFWRLSLRFQFAQLAVGEIYVVLNGSQVSGRSAFRNNSYFSEFELPNFRRDGPYRVTKINTLLLHSPDQVVT